MSMTPAGRFNRKITIQKLDETEDAYGERRGGWITARKTWADIKFNSGLEATKSGAEVSVNKASIRVRYKKNVPYYAGMRVVYMHFIFDVVAVLPDLNQQAYIDLVCEQGQNQG